MGIVCTNKEISTTRINCNGSFQVRLSLTAAPDIVNNPTDIVMVLNRSGNMAGSALASLKRGAKTFIDIIANATDGQHNGQIGCGSRIGIVSFGDSATKDTQMITSVRDLKAAVDALFAGGGTNHADAFTKANELLAEPCQHGQNAKVMVIFSDGNNTRGVNPNHIAAAAKASGTTIYAIGLCGQGGMDIRALKDWASDPSSSYVMVTPNHAEMEELFGDLARNISRPGATDIVLTDQVASCFRIISVAMPTKGTASLRDPHTVRWQIDRLGVNAREGAELEFTVEHTGNNSGNMEVNEAIRYRDAEGNTATFPSPRIDVECDVVDNSEICPEPMDLHIDGCEDSMEFDAGDVGMDLGRIVQLHVRLRNVCPNRRVALAAVLTELDSAGVEHNRGMKTIAVPAHNRSRCTDVSVRSLRFVLPESLDVSNTTGSDVALNPQNSLCNRRNFRARFIAHYIDNDFNCCNNQLQ